MSIDTPSQYTGVHEEEVIQSGDQLQSFTEETYLKMAQNNNWLIDLRPIGTIMFINVNQLGGGAPSPLIWQECNGSEIVNSDSPLRSIGLNTNFTPDLRDRYLKCHTGEVGNPQLGSQDHDLAHNHATGAPSAVGSGLENKGDRRHRVSHTHAVAVQYNNPTVFDSPAFVNMIAYMKVV